MSFSLIVVISNEIKILWKAQKLKINNFDFDVVLRLGSGQGKGRAILESGKGYIWTTLSDTSWCFAHLVSIIA